MINGMVTKVEKRNKYSTWLNPKYYKKNGCSAEKVLSLYDMENFQRLSDCVGVSMQANGIRKIPL